jgi:formylglycine-generating enzyme required for sulfatase activity
MNAGMPDEEHLPPSLTGLVYRNGTGIRRDPDFHRDVDRLIAALKTHFANTAVPTTPQPSLQTIVTPQTDVATSKLVLPMLEWVSIPTGNVTLKINPLQLHHVEAFQISKYPVTHEQFQIFIEDDGYLNDRWWHGLTNRETKPANGQWPIPKHPRENVNWYEAIAFTRWLSNKTGLNITLPTEMEWQRAAEGDSESIYPWGEEFDKKRCNTKISEIGKTTRVDRYPSGVSQFGVMDMSGNVWEWCLNEFDVPSRISTEGDAMRAARGGGWRYHALTTQTSFRNYFNPDERFDCVGFRIALIGMSPFFDRQ